MRDLMTIAACAAGTLCVITFIVLGCALHEWGIAKGRIIQFEQLMKVRPMGAPPQAQHGLRPYSDKGE